MSKLKSKSKNPSPVAAKKKSASAKKKSAAGKKKSASAAVEPVVAKRKYTVSKKRAPKPAAAPDSALLPVDGAHPAIDPAFVNALPSGAIEEMIHELNSMIAQFRVISDNDLTLLQRRRKTGAGIRNYGFIDKASDLADSNPGLARLFSVQSFKNCIRNIEICRDLVILLQTLQRMVSNSLLVYSTEAYSLALIFYNTARELARHGDPNAIEVFRALQPFFRSRGHRQSGAQPTKSQIERDLHAIFRGTKEGEIIVEGESAHTTEGKRVVVDKTRKSKAQAEFKEVEQGEIDE